jgi:hypothetical protein
VQFLTRFEADRFAGGNGNLSTGSGVSPDSGFAGAYIEDAEAAQFDPVAAGEGFFQAFKDGIDGRFRLIAGQTRSLDHIVDDVLLDQRAHLEKSADSSLQLMAMLESFPAIVNAMRLP